jgi:amphi-Trp domain-containing protein
VPNIEIKRKATLSRQEVADRLIALGNALAEGSEVELSSGGDSIKVEVAGQVRWELEIEIDGDETEIEIELKWTDEKPARPTAAAPAAADPQAPADAEPEPAAAATPKAPVRRGRPRKTPAS